MSMSMRSIRSKATSLLHQSTSITAVSQCNNTIRYATTVTSPPFARDVRNIGISAHIDSGKTTLTERILYYTGRISAIHEVRGKDGVGAKMDSMELERERGITIQSAATYATWKDKSINIIDTPGHVDFTIEVERALRVLDGAILVLCAVGGVQSQTYTVARQMKRYDVPCIAFINKIDRIGARPEHVKDQLKAKLGFNAAFIYMPIGLEDDLRGLVDLVKQRSVYFGGDDGSKVSYDEIPLSLREEAAVLRHTLIEAVSEVDDELGELWLEETEPTVEQLQDAIRRTTIARTFTPVAVGSAIKNTGVQQLLDDVVSYLPCPSDVENIAREIGKESSKHVLTIDPDSNSSTNPFVGLAFKLEDGRFGQLTYVRVYQGQLKKGDTIFNTRTNKRIKIPRVVRMHSNEMEDVTTVTSGEICAIFGLECSSGDTFAADAVKNYTMETMYVPNPVMSLSITPQDKNTDDKFGKALARFTREDPTFRSHFDSEAGQMIISGMGELHLNVYAERIRREYGIDVVVGKPRVAFRETITARADFDYLHKKQTGGSGQYARVIGYLEQINVTDDDEGADNMRNEFLVECFGANIPSNYFPAADKGFREACEKGSLTGYPIIRTRFVLTDGDSHSVDSSELAFRIAARSAVVKAYSSGNATVMEPIMKADVVVPIEYQGDVMGQLSKRRGIIVNSETTQGFVRLTVEVPLNTMFGYATDLRTATQGKGEFSMEYIHHDFALPDLLEELKTKHIQELEELKKKNK